MHIDALRPRLKILFENHPVQIAYLFGSQATERAGAESDVDFAVLLDEKLSKTDMHALRMNLIGELSALCQTDRVDLVLLNEAPPSSRI